MDDSVKNRFYSKRWSEWDKKGTGNFGIGNRQARRG